MELDPFTLVAQVLNFLILAWFLKRFLFDRVGRAMDERARRASRTLSEAEAARRDAEGELARNRALRAEMEAGREAA
ncbi:MAG TPA: hypothetical protein VMV44_03615, partial [Rectinemataceae bacterium]|nr:hypothetical protein [Rectinemataceae bacterium]